MQGYMLLSAIYWIMAAAGLAAWAAAWRAQRHAGADDGAGTDAAGGGSAADA